MEKKRLTQAQKFALLLKAAGVTDESKIASAIASIAPEVEKFDGAALQSKIDKFLLDAQGKMPITAKNIAALASLDRAGAEREQKVVLTALYATLTDDEKKHVKQVAGMVQPTAENGNVGDWSALGVTVTSRAPIVHDVNFQRAQGWQLVKDAESKVTDDTREWYNALVKAQNANADKLLHNSDFRACYTAITKKETTSNFDPSSVTWGVLVAKVYAPKA